MIRFRAALASLTVGLLLVALNSCTGPTGPAGSAGPALTGTATGFVVLVKANGSQPARRDSVMVSIDGTALHAMTDSAGQWSIPDLQTGTYDFTFARSGYDTARLIQVQFLGGPGRSVATVNLCQAPGFSVGSLTRLSAIRTDSTTIHLGVKITDSTVSGPFVPYRVFLFLGSDSTVSSSPEHYQSEIAFTLLLQNGMDSTTVRLTPAVFASNGYVAGDQVFIAAYMANAGTVNSSYADTVTGRLVFTNLNPTRSNVVKVTVSSDTTGPAGNGSINGLVTLVASNGFQPPVRDSVLVTIDSTPMQAMTDSTGAWTIPNAGAGTYNLTFAKQGYASAHVIQFGFTGSGTKSTGTVNVVQAPSFSVADLYQRVSVDSTRTRLGIKLTDTTVDDPNIPYRVFLFFGNDSSVSSDPDHYRSVSVGNTMAFQNGVDSTSIVITAAGFANFGFVQGDTVYVAAYAANAGTTNSAYTDPVTGKVVYANINPVRSNVIKVVIE